MNSRSLPSDAPPQPASSGEQSPQPADGLAALARGVIFLTMAPLAVLVPWTHLAQLLEVPFRLYALAGLGLAAVVAALVLWRGLWPHRAAVRQQPAATLVLALAGLLAAGLTLVSHRPDWDDSAYVPNAVYYVMHPDRPFTFAVHYLDLGPEPVASPHLFTSLAFEYSQGIVAWLTGRHLLTIYYLVTPTLLGFMLPLSWFYTLSRFTTVRPWGAVAGAILTGVGLTFLGEMHRSAGNFAFVRLFQGKAVVCSIGLTLLAGLTMDWFRQPSWPTWWRLAALATAAVGMTTSATFLLPMLAVVLTAAAGLSWSRRPGAFLVQAAGYFASLAYVAGYAAWLYLYFTRWVQGRPRVIVDYQAAFYEHLARVFSPTEPVAAVLLAAGTLAAAAWLRGPERRFLLLWAVLVVVLYLNPVVAPVVMGKVHGLYWRVFYLYPFPLVLGLALALAADRIGAGRSLRGNAALAAVLAAAVAAHALGWPTSIYRPGNAALRGPIWKIDPADWARAQAVLEAAPPGTMLAAWPVARTVPLLSGRHPQLQIRHYVSLWLDPRGRRDEARQRVIASEFLYGRPGEYRLPVSRREGLEAVVALVRRHAQVRSVVAWARVVQVTNLESALRAEGFTSPKPVADVVVFCRPAPPAR